MTNVFTTTSYYVLIISGFIMYACSQDPKSGHLSTQADSHENPNWSYHHPGDDPEKWATLCEAYKKCAEGRMQSPIDIETVSARQVGAGELTFNYHPSEVDVQNNGHTIEVDINEDNSLSTGANIYRLKQFHFHEPSEHHLDGIIFPMELHLVHMDSSGKLAVIGAFIKEGTPDTILSHIWESLPSEISTASHLNAPHNFLNIFPAHRTFFHYQGSLTTPPCTEGVDWYVMKEPINLSKSQIEHFKKIYHDNSRPIQPVNNRKIEVSGTF